MCTQEFSFQERGKVSMRKIFAIMNTTKSTENKTIKKFRPVQDMNH